MGAYRTHKDCAKVKPLAWRASPLYSSTRSRLCAPHRDLSSLAVSRLRFPTGVHMAAVLMVLGWRASGALGILPYYASAIPHAKEMVGGSLHWTHIDCAKVNPYTSISPPLFSVNATTPFLIVCASR